jgi:pimeloyl-ACP methyl ester carboxylesterase
MGSLVRDGVSLFYREEGKGAPILFLHPWGGDSRYFAPQVERFRQSHRCVAVDLRGHGQSDKPRQSYSIELFLDDLGWLCRELDLQQPVVIGNSLGGVLALALASHPTVQARAVVCLDAPVVPPPGLMDGFRPMAEALRAGAGPAALRAFTEQLGGFAAEPERKAWLMDQFLGNAEHVMSSALDHILAYDSAPAAAACKAPLLFVSAGPWYTDVPRLRELCPQLMTAQTMGSGHYHELEVPEQVNAILARFLELTAPAPRQ